MLTVSKINSYAAHPKEFIEDAELRYRDKVCELAETIAEDPQKKIVLLAGPSASGKTTTSHLLREELSSKNISSAVVSLDNFYGGSHPMPTLEDGSPDFESVYSLDVEQIHRCLREIIQNGFTNMPVFDFLKHRRSDDTALIDVRGGGILIVEGLHALNPVIADTLPAQNLFKIYISVNNSIYDDDGNKLLSSRKMRLMRRLSRDAVHRSSDALYTLHLWSAVVAGEEKYLYCFKPTADVRLGTLHDYEPCIFKNIILKLLENLPKTAENYDYAMSLAKALEQFQALSPEMVPDSSLIREFL